jgi:hypothetical protein
VAICGQCGCCRLLLPFALLTLKRQSSWHLPTSRLARS